MSQQRIPGKDAPLSLSWALYKNKKSNSPAVESGTWESLCSLFKQSARQTNCTADTCPGKDCPEKNGLLFSPVVIKGRRKEGNVPALSCFVGDLDHLSEEQEIAARAAVKGYAYLLHSTHGHAPPKERALRLVLPLAVPFELAKGEDTASFKKRWEAARAAIIEKFSLPADPACKDLSRMYYLPTHHADVPLVLESAHGPALDLGRLLAEHKPKKEKPRPKVTTRSTARPTGDPPAYLVAALRSALDNVQSAPEGERNNTLNKEAFSIAGFAANPDAGISKQWVHDHFEQAAKAAGLGDSETLKTLRSAIEAGYAEPREIPEREAPRAGKAAQWGAEYKTQQDAPPQETTPFGDPVEGAPKAEDPRPKILQTFELHEVVDQAVSAISSDAELYQRGEEIVTVRRGTKAPKGWKREANAPTIRPLSVASLRERMTRAARWFKYDKRACAYLRALPTDPVVQALFARGRCEELEGIREIRGVVETPFLRPDGSICQEPGFDEETGFLYLPNADYPAIPERPTLEDAKAAVLALSEVVVDFPFVSPSHRAGWLAFQLTLVGRPAIDGPCPLFAFDASVRGSGKTRLVDAASEVAIGRKATRMVLPRTDEEIEKRVTSILLEGDALALIDNVDKPIGGQTLDSLFTAELWKGRLLGKSEMTRALPALCVWSCTGNNLSFVGDIIRRALHIRLEPETDAPEERTGFTHPHLLRWIRDERPRLVAAALTLLRAWFVAGKPGADTRKEWGSFEAWNAIIPPALLWAGEADPVEAHRHLAQTQDEGKSALLAFLLALRAVFGREPKTAKEIIASDNSVLQDALEALCPGKDGRPPSAPSLSGKLRRIKARKVCAPCGGAFLSVVKEDRDPTKTGRWFCRVTELHLVTTPQRDKLSEDAHTTENTAADTLGGEGEVTRPNSVTRQVGGSPSSPSPTDSDDTGAWL